MVEPRSGSKKRSTWLWLGCGCAVLLVLIGLGVGGFVFAIVQKVREAERLSHNPAELRAAVEAIAPFHDLPAGYHPVGTLKLPYLVQLAVFSDRDMDTSSSTDLRLREGASSFTIVKAFSWFGRGRGSLDQEGDRPPQWLNNLGLGYNSSETVSKGQLSIAGHPATYRVVRSRIQRHRRGRLDILMAVLMVDCHDPSWIHTAVWSMPDPHPGEAETGAELAGTPADPEELTRMANHFELCTPGSR